MMADCKIDVPWALPQKCLGPWVLPRKYALGLNPEMCLRPYPGNMPWALTRKCALGLPWALPQKYFGP